MRTCDRCGSKISEDSEGCPICDHMSATERENYKQASKFIFIAVFAITILHAAFYVVNCSKELMLIFRLGSEYKPPSILIHMTQNELSLNFTTVIIMYCLLPAAFLFFNILILLRERSKLMVLFPICGIAAEAAQLAQQCGNYNFAIKEKMSYLYAIIGVDILSALLISGFFAVMVRFILRGYSISQSRWLIVAGFGFVFARVIMKFYFQNDDELIPHFNEIKGYLLFSSTLLNVKKRLITSKTL